MARTSWMQFLAILLLCLSSAFAERSHPRLFQRQETSVSSTLSTTFSKTRTTPTARLTTDSETERSTQTTAAATTATTLSSNSNSIPTLQTSSTLLPVPSNINGPIETSDVRQGNYSYAATPDLLPIIPVITPAFGVGGGILILSGLIYAFMGIKNKWLHTFFSATYLGAVSITVLIIYVMNLPVSNGVQGAYLVAIVLSGMVVGVVAAIFADLTQGLGCLLGGFSFSMWLLVLKSGGLIQNTAGKAILISAFSLASFAASFSQYTRDYALIGCVSFSGATAIMLGLDCFSRAGLKEFWVYIWDLNPNLFPAGATSYPLTRAMKVEVAAIIVITIVGVVSQLKIWQKIKIRRVQKTLQTYQNRHYMEQRELKIGRQVQNRMGRERQQWEAIYGDNDKNVGNIRRHASRDSGVGEMESQKKAGSDTSIRQSAEDHIEMVPMPTPPPKSASVTPTTKSNGAAIVVRVAHDFPPPNGSNEKYSATWSNIKQDTEKEAEGDLDIKREEMAEPKLKRHSSETYLNRSLKPGPTEEPKIIPLPFTISQTDTERDDASSVATMAEDDNENGRILKIDCATSVGRESSQKRSKISQRLPGRHPESSEDVNNTRIIESDRASSIAATLDDFSDDDDDDTRSKRSSVFHLPDSANPGTAEPSTSTTSRDANTPSLTTSNLATINAKSHDSKERPISESTENTNILDIVPTIQSESEAVAQQSSPAGLKVEGQSSGSVGPEASPNQAEEIRAPAAPRGAITEETLPQMSKVVLTYRTNEWAKHLDTAETPELDELQLNPQLTDIQDADAEAAKRVDVEALQQTSDMVFTPRSVSQMSNRMAPTNAAVTRNYPPIRSTSAHGHYSQVAGLSRNASQQSISRNTGHRISMTPTTTPIFGKRDSIVHARQSYYGNGAALTSMPEFGNRSGSSSEADPKGHYNATLDDDSLSLAARRKVIRQSSLQYPPSVHQGRPSLESHQPKRQSTISDAAARELQLASWRASVTQDLQSTVQPRNMMERSRSALFQERQAEEQRRALQAHIKAQKEHAFDERMRSRDMLDAHRDALRKMQSKANKSVV